MSRAEVDLQISVRKACNSVEGPPKRKHVRACIVYTWDHKNSRSFWNALKIQPLQSSEVQLFKALIMIHKILQEGHPNTLKDGYGNRDFLYSLSTVFPSTSNYGLLINQYDRFLLQKLDFHRSNPGFNGIFEYEEYVSLRSVNDPNEGYESILQLMDLQDLISDLQKHIFVTVHQSPNSLCKVSALVPMISESYGIYKFLVSMLRAMFQQLGDDKALSALFERFKSQHFVLRDFYTDCHSIKFLTSLVTIPRIAGSVPNLRSSDESSAGPNNPGDAFSTQANNIDVPPPISSFDAQKMDAVAQQRLLEQQHHALEAQRQQQLFERQMKEHEERMLQEQQVLRQQQTQATQLRVSELEQDLLIFKTKFDNDQALLHQYDARVESMESELFRINETAAQQIVTKDEELLNANKQICSWAKKYESLTKLYSQLRLEHLNLLAKFKKIQQKISSAQESILKKERFEKDLRAKNLELADIIRERDRARLDLDRVKASKDMEIERLQSEVREASTLVNESSEAETLDLISRVRQYEAEIEKLNVDLQDRELKLASISFMPTFKEKLEEREMDLEITQESLDSVLKELAISKNLPSSKTLISTLDVILANSVRRVQDSKYQLLSPMQAGNMKATPEYLLSFLNLCSDKATNFAQTFNDLVVEGDENGFESPYTLVILASSEFTSALNDFMLNLKGLSKNLIPGEADKLADHTTDVLTSAESFFLSMTSDAMESLQSEEEKINFVIDCNLLFQRLLQVSSSFIDTLRSGQVVAVLNESNIEDAVENKFSHTADVVEKASIFLRNLMADVKEQYFDVHESILSAALAITKAVLTLIAVAAESQKEIVCQNKGESTSGEFYRKNSRWTEGLISASKAVAGATNILIQTANGVLKNENFHEQLIVACNEVAASTAQLVAASRVKANFMSKTQDTLEDSSKVVNSACKSLVLQVQKFIRNEKASEVELNLNDLTTYEGKTLEMEQQVEILKLENSLSSARKKLAEIRKHGYTDNFSGDES